MVDGESGIPGIKKGKGDSDGLIVDTAEVHRDGHRNKAFKKIQEEAENSVPFSKGSKNVGGTDITRAMLPNIDAFQFSKEKPKGDGTQKESEKGKKPDHLFGAADGFDDDGRDGNILVRSSLDGTA